MSPLMPELVRFPKDSAVGDLLEVIARDDALILEDALSPEQVDHTLAEFTPHIEATRIGSEDLLEKLKTTIEASGEERNP